MKRLIFILASGMLMNHLSAQTPVEPCGQVELLNHLETLYPGFKAHYDATYLQQVNKKVVQNRKVNIHDSFYTYDTIYTIPIVFHVLYHVNAENIHDSLLKNQIEVLNQCYRRRNPDTSKTRKVFKSRAGDTRIQFELASIKPDGTSTTGIVKKYTSTTSWDVSSFNDLMKASSSGGDDPWDTKKYLNIWVCNIKPSGNSQILGYAFPPYGQPFWASTSWVADNRQGVVLFYANVGRNNPVAQVNYPNNAMGKTAVHEVGHYLGLRHISGDPQFSNEKCVVDDYLFDTPKQGGQTQGNCPVWNNTCLETNDLPDQIENYMDYSSEPCQNMFTKQQISVMRQTMEIFRTTLASKVEIIATKHYFDTIVFNELKVYVTDKQRVYFELKNSDVLNQLKVDAYDLSGKIITRDVALTKNENYLSTVNFAPGIYVFVIKDLNNKVIRKDKFYISKN